MQEALAAQQAALEAQRAALAKQQQDAAAELARKEEEIRRLSVSVHNNDARARAESEDPLKAILDQNISLLDELSQLNIPPQQTGQTQPATTQPATTTQPTTQPTTTQQQPASQPAGTGQTHSGSVSQPQPQPQPQQQPATMAQPVYGLPNMGDSQGSGQTQPAAQPQPATQTQPAAQDTGSVASREERIQSVNSAAATPTTTPAATTSTSTIGRYSLGYVDPAPDSRPIPDLSEFDLTRIRKLKIVVSDHRPRMRTILPQPVH